MCDEHNTLWHLPLVELNKLKSPLKCRQTLCTHPCVKTAGVVLSVVTAVTRLAAHACHGLKSPNIAGAAPSRMFLLQIP